jgi:hypothetical protein
MFRMAKQLVLIRLDEKLDAAAREQALAALRGLAGVASVKLQSPSEKKFGLVTAEGRKPKELAGECRTVPGVKTAEPWPSPLRYIYGRYCKRPTPQQRLGRELLAELRKPAGKCDVGKALGLLRTDLSVDERSWTGISPLALAAAEGHEAVVRALLDKNASIDAPDVSRNTPLIRAIQGGHAGIARLLLEAGALADFMNADGLTPLHLAVDKGDAGTVAALLAHGARPDRRSKTGKNDVSPLGLAEKKNSGTGAGAEIYALLVQAVARKLAAGPETPKGEKSAGENAAVVRLPRRGFML